MIQREHPVETLARQLFEAEAGPNETWEIAVTERRLGQDMQVAIDEEARERYRDKARRQLGLFDA